MNNGFFENLFNEAFRAFSEFDALAAATAAAANNSANSITVTNNVKDFIQFGSDPSGFPKGDLAEDKDGNYHIIFSIGGYGEDDFEIDYKDNYVTLTLNRPEKYGEDWKFFARGLKLPKKVTKSTLVDTRKYDVSKISWEMLPNNLLDIVIKKRKDFIAEYSIKKGKTESIAETTAEDKKED